MQCLQGAERGVALVINLRRQKLTVLAVVSALLGGLQELRASLASRCVCDFNM